MRKRLFLWFQIVCGLWVVIPALIVSTVVVTTGVAAETGSTTVAVGNTEDEVRQILGNPRGKMKQGKGALWLYDGSEVFFENGKVASVGEIAARPVPVSTPNPIAPVKQEQPRQLKKTEPAGIKIASPVSAPAPVINSSSVEDRLPAALRSLKQMWSDPSGTYQSRIYCNFAMPSLSPAALQAQKQKGTIPFRVTAVIMSSTQSGTTAKDKWALVRTGSCLIRLFDENGVEVLSATMPADKMCPS